MSDKLEKREETAPETVSDRLWVTPRVDIYENEDEVLLLADLPGVAGDRLSINLDKNDLTLEAEAGPATEGNALRSEFGEVGFRRAFTLPTGIDAEKITADLKHGVLHLHLPKSEAHKPRQITVQAG